MSTTWGSSCHNWLTGQKEAGCMTPSFLFCRSWLPGRKCAAIIASNKKGLLGKFKAESNLINHLSNYWDFQGERFYCCQMVSRAPKKVQQDPGPPPKLFQLRDRATTSAKLTQEWQQAGEAKTFSGRPGINEVQQKSHFYPIKQQRQYLCHSQNILPWMYIPTRMIYISRIFPPSFYKT